MNNAIAKNKNNNINNHRSFYHYNTQTHHIPVSRNITLHHRIRDNSHNPHSQAIKDFDQRIVHNPHSLTDEDVEEYVDVSVVFAICFHLKMLNWHKQL